MYFIQFLALLCRYLDSETSSVKLQNRLIGGLNLTLLCTLCLFKTISIHKIAFLSQAFIHIPILSSYMSQPASQCQITIPNFVPPSKVKFEILFIVREFFVPLSVSYRGSISLKWSFHMPLDLKSALPSYSWSLGRVHHWQKVGLRRTQRRSFSGSLLFSFRCKGTNKEK